MNSTQGLQFEYTDALLIVRASGRGKIETKAAAVQAIAAALAAQPVVGALVDLREVDGPYTFMDRYQLGELAGIHLSKIPVAVLAHEIQTDKQRIGKLVAINRGACLEVFTELNAALAWLKKNCPRHVTEVM